MKSASVTEAGTKKISFKYMGNMTHFYVEREIGLKDGIKRYRGRIMVNGSSVRGVLSESSSRRIFMPTNKSLSTSSKKILVNS